MNIELTPEEVEVLKNVLKQVSAPVLSKESDIIRSIYHKIIGDVKNEQPIST